MDKVVTIPYGYEELPLSEQRRIVPICLARFDPEGNEIARGWFDAVSGIQEMLRNLARHVVQDVRRTSEVVDPAVQNIWSIHQDRLGRCPEAQVYAFSKWSARRIREQDLGLATRTRRIVALETLSEAVLKQVLVDPIDYEALYQREMDLEQMNRGFLERGLEDVSMMYDLVRDGRNWKDIGERMDRDPNSAQRRFRRWRNKIAGLMNGSPGTAGKIR